MQSLIYLVLLLYEAIHTSHSAFVKTSLENFRRDRLDQFGGEGESLDFGGLYDLSFYRRDKNSKSSASAKLKTEGFTSPAPTEPRIAYDCPFYEWTNGVTNKKLRVMTREALEHYFNKDPLSLGNHETITSQAMQEECALFGPGWETLEIEEFGDFIYILTFLLLSRNNENVCSDPAGVDHIGAWGIALNARWNTSAGEWVWPRSGSQVVQGVLIPDRASWVDGSNTVPGATGTCNVAFVGRTWHEKQFSGCPGKGLAPWWQYRGDDANRYPVPLILFSRPDFILNSNCQKYRGPNDETPPPELLVDAHNKQDICANTLFCGGRGTEPGDQVAREMCEVAHDKMAVKYSVSNGAKNIVHLPNAPDPNAKIYPSQVCQKKQLSRPKEIFPNITRG